MIPTEDGQGNFSVNVELIQDVGDVMLKVNAYFSQNRVFKKFLIDIDLDCCAFTSGKIYLLLFKYKSNIVNFCKFCVFQVEVQLDYC